MKATAKNVTEPAIRVADSEAVYSILSRPNLLAGLSIKCLLSETYMSKKMKFENSDGLTD